MKTLPEVEIFTDGACHGNPGPGGWGALLRANGKEKKLSGAEKLTTNNRMELMAVIKALEALKGACKVTITTDSKYVKNGMTTWIKNWKKNGWRNSSKKEVKNVELWKRLDKAAARHQISWRWVKGHAGHPENELADQLATEAIEKN